MVQNSHWKFGLFLCSLLILFSCSCNCKVGNFYIEGSVSKVAFVLPKFHWFSFSSLISLSPMVATELVAAGTPYLPAQIW